MNIFKKLIEKLKATSSLVIPKIIIHFESSGCMAQNKEFIWIGYVTKEYTKFDSKVDFYEVQPLVKYSTEHRDYPLEKETAWQIQHLMWNVYIFTT